MLMTGLGVGYWLSALNIEYRDVVYALPFISQIWMFLSPVVYSSSLVPEKWRILYGLNPMAGVIDGFRWALLGIGPGPSPLLLASSCITILLFVTGVFWFRSRERTFADAIGSGGR
jgi:lipopolysaccharide transport system permease protein